MKLPDHKTKIVCTIGPASVSPEMMKRMLRSGHERGPAEFFPWVFRQPRKVIANLRAAAHAVGRRVAIMADLPGPKMRIGKIKDEPVDLIPGDDLADYR